MYKVSEGTPDTTETFKTLDDAKLELLVRYCYFTNDLTDCYYTPPKTEKQLYRAKSFEFYGLGKEDKPDYSRKYYATIEKIAA